MRKSLLLQLIPDAPLAARDFLDSDRGLLQPPVRSQIFGLQRFEEHGHSLGNAHRMARTQAHSSSFFPRLQGNIETLRQAQRYIGTQASTGYDISPAGEWLLDNFHLIDAQLRAIHIGLPRNYFRTLPTLLDSPLAGLPRIYGVAWAFVAHTDSAFDEELLTHFLNAYQETCELNLSEMWALPTTLRVVLIENLRRLAERVATNKAAREVANLCCDHIKSFTPDALDELLSRLNARGVGHVLLTQMAQRLQDCHATGDECHHAWLAQVLPDPAAVQAQQSADQAADNLSVSNAVTSLRDIGDADWPDIVASTSVLMKLMLTSALFEAEHLSTRDQTLHAVERLAKQSHQSEVSVARVLMQLMRPSSSPGSMQTASSHWLHGPGRRTLLTTLGLSDRSRAIWVWLHPFRLTAYLLTWLLGTLALVNWLQMSPPWGAWLTSLLLAMPASEAVLAVINRLISESTPPHLLPRLAWLQGIPAEHRVLAVIPTMLSTFASTTQQLHRLELHYLANPEPFAQFALLTDWQDAASAHVDTDEALLNNAQAQIHALNARYPCTGPTPDEAPRFILLHRPRQFSVSEQCWIGWERKRGKLEQLVHALATGQTDAFIDLGASSRMARHVPYIVTLDTDTQLPPGQLRQLVSIAAHPDNQPRLDADGRVVLSGYGILQPRIVTPFPTPQQATRYHWLFAGQCGTDPYSAASSEVYQDLFHEGTFSGKGLLHVKAMHAVLTNRLPQDQVLSHDLLEGAMVRCAVVSDINLIEDAPAHADVANARMHRWIRGDWQLLPLMLHARTYGLRAIHLWKMLDNLRRSLLAPASLALLAAALMGHVLSPWAALGLVVMANSAGTWMGVVSGFFSRHFDLARRHFYRRAWVELFRTLLGSLWLLSQLLPTARSNLDAIARALYRTQISRRHLLQWTTAEAVQASAHAALLPLLRQHWRTPLAAGLLLAALLLNATPHPIFAMSLCVLWAASPVGIWWISRAYGLAHRSELPEAQRAYLEGIARDTWRYFERCVGAQDHHLPPDNLQVTPHDLVAHRTSPTNIGMYLLSVASARRFGWIGTQDLLNRIEATLATLLSLQRHRGHFLNWYDTQSCAPLLPLYVSAVDSGNLCAHLLTVAQSCRAFAREASSRPTTQQAMHAAMQRLQPLLKDRVNLTPDMRQQLAWCLADHQATKRSARLDSLADQTQFSKRLLDLAHRLEQLVWQADFRFLYHPKRHLFHIGYRVAEQQLDTGFYDLLASESRLTSLLAIAKGDVPVRHWASLGRPFYVVGPRAGLRSWSGSMFEYLMPQLIVHEPRGSALYGACQMALREQMDFAQRQGVPWGISESAYAGHDHTLAYQYAPQGVPRLALRRTPADELVIAPYATALAAMLSPQAASMNFLSLEAMSARGRYGFIDALDFSPSRQTGDTVFTPVNTYMAHHQGMTIVSLANVLLGEVVQDWGMGNPYIEAVASLLHERTPREIATLYAPPSGPAVPPIARHTPGLLRDVSPGMSAVEPTHLLSNGRYHVSLRANGAGVSRWNTIDINRWRDDALRDAYGSFFYLRWHPANAPVSVTQHPAPDPAAHYQSTYHADRVTFDTTWLTLQTQTTVWVSPEDDIEFRQIELRNLSSRHVDIELISAFEVALSDPRADEAHPAFTNLFVRATWIEAHQALLFERKPRLPTEPALQAAHFLAHSDPHVVSVNHQSNRQIWMGRNLPASQPLATFPPSSSPLPPSAEAGQATPLDTGLDPVCALSVKLRIAPGAKACLTFATAASDHGSTLHAVIDKYRQHSHVQRASLISATLAGIRLRVLRINSQHFSAIQTLTTALVMSLTRQGGKRSPPGEPGQDGCDQRSLWRLGISGDRPIFLVSIDVVEGLGLLQSLAQVLQVWAWAGVGCDLVIIHNEPASYEMPLYRALLALQSQHLKDIGGAQRPSPVIGLHLVRSLDLSRDERNTLHHLARIRLHADGRPLSIHLQEWVQQHEQALALRQSTSSMALATMSPPAAGTQVSVGEFTADGSEFHFSVKAHQRPLKPWINVLSNPGFGAQISEAGGGYTWAVNSRLNQLTAWSNDPVADPPSEWFLLQDTDTLQVWSVSPSAWGDGRLSYHVAHGQGLSTIRHQRGPLAVSVTWCVDPDTAIKQVCIRLINQGPKALHLRVIGMLEWMMGATRIARATTSTALHRQRLSDTHQLSAVTCMQRERAAGHGQGTAFLALAHSSTSDIDWTCDRREFFDARGQLVLPDHLGQHRGNGLDPCAALGIQLRLEAGATAEQSYLIGYAENPQAAHQLAARATERTAQQRITHLQQQWDTRLNTLTVQTPDPLFDAMVNRWLLYQTISCRLWAKSGFYQAGGATGFRDQMQDAMALSWAAPDMLRQQIVRNASRQFAEGDVQHWWHAPLGNGVRTHFSDDLLWLPHACTHYLKATGDTSLLDQSVPFIEGQTIPPGAEDSYYTPTVSTQHASVYEHAARAIDHSLTSGVHGLPLMGSGDWNDGMNLVGAAGQGESVWLGWFLCDIVAHFAPLARARGDTARASRWEDAAQGWREALGSQAWDGQWFKRAYFDNGQPLGSHDNTEARIDLIAQSWAVLSGVAPLAQQRQAMASADARLVDPVAGLIKLLDPPLINTQPIAGYIQAYPPGVRENGSQYSHAGVWALMAQARLAPLSQGTPEAATAMDTPYRYFAYLSPAHRAAHPTHGAAYGIEPYVVAGDVYTQPPYVGRGGWSWYTGAAAWLHRAAIESIFGLNASAQTVCFTPCLPTHWPEAEITLKRNGLTLRFLLLRASPQDALVASRISGATLLPPGQHLSWPALKQDTCFVVPLLPG